MPAVPARQAYPPVSFGWLAASVPAGETVYIKEGPINAQPLNDEWIAGVNRSFDIVVNGFSPGWFITLVVEGSLGGVIHHIHDNIAVNVGATRAVTVVSDYLLPYWTVKFAVYNPMVVEFIGARVMIAARGR